MNTEGFSGRRPNPYQPVSRGWVAKWLQSQSSDLLGFGYVRTAASDRREILVMSRDNDSIQVLTHFHTQAITRFHARRQVEWQFSFTLWVLLGAVTVAARELPRWSGVIMTVVLGAAATGLHWKLQEKYVQNQMKRDWSIGIEIDRHLRSFLDEDVVMAIPKLSPDTDVHHPYSNFWSHGWQVAVTATIAVVAVLSVVLT